MIEVIKRRKLAFLISVIVQLVCDTTLKIVSYLNFSFFKDMRGRGRKGNFFLYPAFNKSSLPTLAKLPLSIFVALILFLILERLL